MRFFIFIIILILINNCSNTKKTYWCGDHPCINKTEREAYFRKNMTVEVVDLSKKNEKEISEIEIIMKDAKKKEKQRIKNKKKRKKNDLLNKKKLAKMERSEKKREKLKNKEKNKQAKLKQKKIKTKKKKVATNEVMINTEIAKINISSSKFEKILESITKRNMNNQFPDINDIPN